MGSWVDQEQGQKVPQGVPAYYGTFQGGQPQQQQTAYPPVSSYPPQGDGQAYGQGGDQAYGRGGDQAYGQGGGQTYGQGGGQGYAPVRESRFMEGRPLLGGEHYEGSGSLPFCNLGYGWFLFLLGFFFVLPWYVGVVLLFCLAHDQRERAGLIACTLASAVVLFFGGWRTSYYYYG